MNLLSLKDIQLKAGEYITGGMSSSFRANVYNGLPMYATKADGAYLYDATGKQYIDFFMCNGAVLLGHNNPSIRAAIKDSLDKGFFAGYDSSENIDLARLICKAIPSSQQIRYVNSGSEGTLLSLRLARGYTGKEIIIRMDGHFHGIHDYLLANNLVSKVDYDNPGDRVSRVIGRTCGIPKIIDQTVITIPWNNIDILTDTIKSHHHNIAGIIMNIIDYNNGCIGTTTEYLQAVRNLADEYNIVLIFDEILSGFKTGLSCAQGMYGVYPDICTLGKALTNDVPLGVVAGKKEIMNKIMDPTDPVISGGTFSGNQLGVAAGLASMKIFEQPSFYDEFLARVEHFYQEFQNLFNDHHIPAYVQHIGAGFAVYFGTEKPVKNYFDYKKLDKDMEREFFLKCLDQGLYFHTDFTVSAAHDDMVLNEALNRLETVIHAIKK